tara:strand:- start:2921 stop:4759 length:1839 start_codon:yes stop_codon:yes gene_type:complete
MPSKEQSFKVICGGGLNSNENHLDLSDNLPGSASRLVNYEVSLFGGYRRLEGYAPLNTSHSEVDPVNAEGRILGIALFKDDAAYNTKIIAARKTKVFTFTATAGQTTFSGADVDGRTLTLNNEVNTTVTSNGSTVSSLGGFTTTPTSIVLASGASVGDTVVIDTNEYKFYRYVAFSAWAEYSTGLIHKFKHGTRTVQKIRHTNFNFSSSNRICFVDGVNNAVVHNSYNWKYLSPTGTGTESDPGGPMAPERPELVDAFENHLFLGGDRVATAMIAYSKPLDPLDFTPAAGSNQLGIGFDVVAFKAFRDNLYVFGENGIKSISADLTAGFVTDQITNNVGCVARDSVLEIGGDLIFLAPDGIRPVAGTSRIGDVELETISKSIQRLLSELPADYDLSTLDGVVVRSKSQMRYFIGDATLFAADSFGIIGGLRSSDQRLGWEFGELLGIRASCCTSSYIGTDEFILHGDYDGRVFRQEQGTTFNGTDILSIYRTPYYDFGDTEVSKGFKSVKTFIRAEGPVTINLSATYDWEDSNTASPSSYVASSLGAPQKYKGANINYNGDGITYGGSSKPTMLTSIQGSGYSAQITYVTIGNFNPYSIQGFVFEFDINGRD